MLRMWYTRVAVTLALALLVLTGGARPARAAVDLHRLGLTVEAFPAGAVITREHVDTTAAATP